MRDRATAGDEATANRNAFAEAWNEFVAAECAARPLVIIVDDLLATGGTAMAAATLVQQLGANIVEIDFLIELSFLKGRERLKEHPLFAAIVY